MNNLDEDFLEEYGEIVSSQVQAFKHANKSMQNLHRLVSYLSSKSTVQGKRQMRMQGNLIKKKESEKERRMRLKLEDKEEKGRGRN